MPDVEHCGAIKRISDAVSQRCGEHLVDARLRYGSAQKAFNLYSKFLWRLGEVATLPHCPVDSIVLAEAKIEAAWTRSDSEDEYVGWINRVKIAAKPIGLAEWEYLVWLRGAVK